MVKKYDPKKIKKGILEFSTELHSFNTKKSHATIIPPFPGLKELGVIDKNARLIVSIKVDTSEPQEK